MLGEPGYAIQIKNVPFLGVPNRVTRSLVRKMDEGGVLNMEETALLARFANDLSECLQLFDEYYDGQTVKSLIALRDSLLKQRRDGL